VINNPLINTFRNLKGNAKPIVLTEPLWGIPYFLYSPYVSVYMLALGVKDSQIGLIATIGLVFQIFFALLSGVITDKLGRKRTTLIFDLLSWSVSIVIWAIARDINYFILAVIVNAAWRVPSTSWSCLLVEDTPQEQLVPIYSWIYISGLLVAFFSPIAGLLIRWYSLVPTMRGLYALAFVMMTFKFLIMNHYVKETRQGLVRMQETRDQPLFAVLGEYRGVFSHILKSPKIRVAFSIWLVLAISMMINSTFWAVNVTQRLHISDQSIAYYQFARSLVMLALYFIFMPRISLLPFKKPMLVGFIGWVLSQTLLVIIPAQNYLLLLVSVLLEAISSVLVNPFLDTMVVRSVDPQERARIMALMAVVVITLTSPFGWIAGRLSEMNRALPFVLNIALFAIGAVLVVIAGRVDDNDRVEIRE